MEYDKHKLNIFTANLLISFIPIFVYFSGIKAIPLSLGRFGFAFIGIGIFFVIKNRKALTLKKSKKNVYLLLSGIFHATTTLTFFYSINNTSPTFAVLSLSIGMLLYTATSNYIRSKKQYIPYILLYLLLLIVLFISFFEIVKNSSTFALLSSILSGLSIAAVFSIGEYAKRYFDGIKITFYQNLIGFTILFILVIIFIKIPIPQKTDYIYLAVLGIISTAIPYLLTYHSINKITPIFFSIMTILQIIPALIFDIFFLHKEVDFLMITGLIIIVMALYIGALDIPNIINKIKTYKLK